MSVQQRKVPAFPWLGLSYFRSINVIPTSVLKRHHIGNLSSFMFTDNEDLFYIVTTVKCSNAFV